MNWHTHKVPTGIASFEAPADWQTEVDDGALHVFPEDDTGAVTVREFEVDDLTVEDMIRDVQDSFESAERVATNVGETGGTHFIREEYLDEDGTHWLVVALLRGDTHFYVTANEISDAWPERADIYRRIIDSFTLT